MKRKKRYLVSFYADSWKYGPNYLFRFNVWNESEGAALAVKMKARAAWIRDNKTGAEKRIW